MVNRDTESSSRQRSPFADDTDEDLLGYMAEKESDPYGARQAWEEFYNRHCAYVRHICYRVCHGRLDDGEIMDIVIDTFRKVFERGAATYRTQTGQTPGQIQRRVRAWLGVVARNATRDILQGRRGDPAIQIEQEEWQYIRGGQEVRGGEDMTQVRAIMEDVLSERELLVLWATYKWYKLGEKNQRLPAGVVADLCEQFQTTPENLRKIRQRATRKVKEALLVAGYGASKSS